MMITDHKICEVCGEESAQRRDVAEILGELTRTDSDEWR